MPFFDTGRARARRRVAMLFLATFAAVFGAACAPLPAPRGQAPQPMASAWPASPPPAPVPVPVSVSVPVPSPSDVAARRLLAYEEQLAPLTPIDLAPELARLGDGSASPQAAMELALLLGHTRVPGDLARAQGLLDQVQRDPSPAAQAWHGLARLLSYRYGEQRRAEEQADRLNQQLRDTQRDNQRKLDQLNEKLEALKAIERSLNNRQPAGRNGNAP